MAVLPQKKEKNGRPTSTRVRRTPHGWSEPERLETLINSLASEWHTEATKETTNNTRDLIPFAILGVYGGGAMILAKVRSFFYSRFDHGFSTLLDFFK